MGWGDDTAPSGDVGNPAAGVLGAKLTLGAAGVVGAKPTCFVGTAGDADSSCKGGGADEAAWLGVGS